MKTTKSKKQAPASVKKETPVEQVAAPVTQNPKPQPVSEGEEQEIQSDLDDQMNEEFQLDGDVQLPKATMYQLIQEKLPDDVRITNASKDVLIQLAMCFINALSAKANVVCGERGKKTIFPEHVLQAMHQNNQTALLAPIFHKTRAQFSKLSFEKQKDVMFQAINGSEYQQRLQRSKSIKGNNAVQGHAGISQEELIAEQQKMFTQSRQYEIEFQKQQQEQHYQAQLLQHSSSMTTLSAGQNSVQFGQGMGQGGYQSNLQGGNYAIYQQQSMGQPVSVNVLQTGPVAEEQNYHANGSDMMQGQFGEMGEVEMMQEPPEERIRNLILNTNFENHTPIAQDEEMPAADEQALQEHAQNGQPTDDQQSKAPTTTIEVIDVDEEERNSDAEDSADEVMFKF